MAAMVDTGSVEYTRDRTGLEPEWLSTIMGTPVESAVFEEMPQAGGLSCEVRRVLVVMRGGSTKRLVLKTKPPEAEARAKELGLSREALFFAELGPALSESLRVPRALVSCGSMETGAKAILLPEVSGWQAGYFFGPWSPHNKGKDLDAIVAAAGPGSSTEDVTRAAFVTAARLHAAYWADRTDRLLGRDWLRGAAWYRGAGRESWDATQRTASSLWTDIRGRMRDRTDGTAGMEHDSPIDNNPVRWESSMVRLVDASIGRISWEAYQSEIMDRSHTLVHGDFHPANMMWTSAATADEEGADAEETRRLGRLVLLDWEAVGVGNGPQDLAQFFISHASPEDRRRLEGPMVAEYHAELVRAGVTDFSLDKCREEYSRGGAERWVWLLALLAAICPAAATQYFHDQLHAFVTDHGITPETIGQPRP